MWVFSHIKTGRRFYLLTNSKKYTVGRSQQSDLCFPDDTSISREHALIHRSSSGVRIEDLGSKYGVYINSDIDINKPIAAKTPVALQAGHIVRFGRLENIFRLENIEIKVSTSTMPPEGIESLKKQLKFIDGKLQNAWSTDCTHLVMPSVTVTVKVLQSLAYGMPIVSSSYWDAYIECARQNKIELPDVNDFVPEITEPYIIKESGMMAVHLDRQRLFQNKTFVFMVKRHMEKFEPVIKLAAGKCVNMEDGKIRKSFLLKADCIPVQYTPSANTQCSSDVESIVTYIETNKRRLINESEIGLAILHRSVDRFCNPDRKMVSDFEPKPVDTNEIIKDVLMEETPHTRNTEQPVLSSIVIPESVDLTGTEPNNNLRMNEAVDLDKSSTSSPRKSARLSAKHNVSTNVAQTLTASNPQKRKHTEKNDHDENMESEPQELQQNSTAKKQKIDDGNQGEHSLARFVELMPPPSQSDLNLSGFISTQNRRNRLHTDGKQATVQTTETKNNAESTKVNRKRAIDLLACDSDEDNNDDGNIFNFNRKSKRPKTTSKVTKHSGTQRKFLEDDDDDDDAFSFRRTQTKQKQKDAAVCETDGPIAEPQDSFTKPYQHFMNRTLNRTVTPIEFVPAPKCDTEWISMKMKRELSFDDKPQPSSSVMVKEEKLEEWEMNDEEKKRRWIKSLANAFEVRKIEVNLTRRSAVDETDSIFSESSNSTLNKTKNFKKFVKKNNYIPRTMVIKTTPVPVMVSEYARI